MYNHHRENVTVMFLVFISGLLLFYIFLVRCSVSWNDICFVVVAILLLMVLYYLFLVLRLSIYICLSDLACMNYGIEHKAKVVAISKDSIDLTFLNNVGDPTIVRIESIHKYLRRYRLNKTYKLWEFEGEYVVESLSYKRFS